MKATNKQAEEEQPISVMRTVSRKITKNSAPSAGPRNERMPPMIDHRQQLTREGDRDRIGRGHAVVEQQQHAGEPGHRRRDHERDQLVAIGRIADEAARALVLADRHQHVPTGERWKRHST